MRSVGSRAVALVCRFLGVIIKKANAWSWRIEGLSRAGMPWGIGNFFFSCLRGLAWIFGEMLPSQKALESFDLGMFVVEECDAVAGT